MSKRIRPIFPGQYTPNTHFATHFERNPLPEVLEVVVISYSPTVEETVHTVDEIQRVDEELALAIGNSKRLIGKKLVYHKWVYPTRTDAASHVKLLSGRYKFEALTPQGGHFDNFTYDYDAFFNKRRNRW